MNYNYKENIRFGITGFLGGFMFMIGDCLIYVYPGRNIMSDVDHVFSSMPIWRFIASAFFGVIGMSLMLFGFHSLYAMTKQICGKKTQRLMLIGGMGVAGSALAHFNLGSLLPLTYKAILTNGGSEIMATHICKDIADLLMPLNIVIFSAIYVQFFVLLYIILSGKAGVPRWLIIMSPIGAVTIGVLWGILFRNTALAGYSGCCESMGEGLMYIVAMFYWKTIERTRTTSKNIKHQI